MYQKREPLVQIRQETGETCQRNLSYCLRHTHIDLIIFKFRPFILRFVPPPDQTSAFGYYSAHGFATGSVITHSLYWS